MEFQVVFNTALLRLGLCLLFGELSGKSHDFVPTSPQKHGFKFPLFLVYFPNSCCFELLLSHVFYLWPIADSCRKWAITVDYKPPTGPDSAVHFLVCSKPYLINRFICLHVSSRTFADWILKLLMNVTLRNERVNVNTTAFCSLLWGVYRKLSLS